MHRGWGGSHWVQSTAQRGSSKKKKKQQKNPQKPLLLFNPLTRDPGHGNPAAVSRCHSELAAHALRQTPARAAGLRRGSDSRAAADAVRTAGREARRVGLPNKSGEGSPDSCSQAPWAPGTSCPWAAGALAVGEQKRCRMNRTPLPAPPSSGTRNTPVVQGTGDTHTMGFRPALGGPRPGARQTRSVLNTASLPGGSGAQSGGAAGPGRGGAPPLTLLWRVLRPILRQPEQSDASHSPAASTAEISTCIDVTMATSPLLFRSCCSPLLTIE